MGTARKKGIKCGASSGRITNLQQSIFSLPVFKNNFIRSIFNFPRSKIIDNRVICAGALGVDSCKGDSGGPLVYRASHNEPWTLIGIVSFGDAKCGNGKAGIYTSVVQFMDWIRENLEP